VDITIDNANGVWEMRVIDDSHASDADADADADADVARGVVSFRQFKRRLFGNWNEPEDGDTELEGQTPLHLGVCTYDDQSRVTLM
jgi:hypothetical protein